MSFLHFLKEHSVWKSQKSLIQHDKSSLIMPEMRSNSVIRQVNFLIGQKLVKNAKIEMRHFGWFSNIVKRHKQGKVKQFNRFLWMKYTSENLNGKAYFDYFSISFWSSHLSIQIAPERSHRVLLQFNRSANIPASARSSLHCDAQRFPLQIQFTLKMDLDIQRFSDAQLLERHSCYHLEPF